MSQMFDKVNNMVEPQSEDLSNRNILDLLPSRVILYI